MFRNNFVPVKIVAIFVMFYEPCVNLLLLFRKVSCRGYKKKKVSCRCLFSSGDWQVRSRSAFHSNLQDFLGNSP